MLLLQMETATIDCNSILQGKAKAYAATLHLNSQKQCALSLTIHISEIKEWPFKVTFQASI